MSKVPKKEKPKSSPSYSPSQKSVSSVYVRECALFGNSSDVISIPDINEWIDQRILFLIDQNNLHDSIYVAESTVVKSIRGFETEIIIEETSPCSSQPISSNCQKLTKDVHKTFETIVEGGLEGIWI